MDFKQVPRFNEYQQGTLDESDICRTPWSDGLPFVCRWENGWTVSRIYKAYGTGVYIHKHLSGWLVFRDVVQFRDFVRATRYPKLEEM